MAIQFCLTNNSALIAEYCELRNRVYHQHYPHLAADFGQHDSVDTHSHIVIGYYNRVVAGARITISRPGSPRLMPMEESGFRLAEALPEFRLGLQPYAEFSRVAVDPAFAAGRHCSMRLIQELVHTAAGFGIDLVFSICPDAQVRWNAWNSRKCGVTFQTFPDIEIPTPFGIRMTLCAYTGLVAADKRFLGLTA
jgi:hypothetical protein